MDIGMLLRPCRICRRWETSCRGGTLHMRPVQSAGRLSSHGVVWPPLSTPFVHLDATCAANCSGLALSKPSIGARCFPKPRPWTEGSITESSGTNQSCLSQLNCRRRRITTCMIPTARPPTLPNPSSPRSLQPPSPLRLTTRLRN